MFNNPNKSLKLLFIIFISLRHHLMDAFGQGRFLPDEIFCKVEPIIEYHK